MNINRCQNIIFYIEDALTAISMELHKPNPQKPYLNEKLKPILNDVKCLEYEFSEEE